ncbi:MAG TPA: hypothetical protein DDX25_11215, partial [Firmicutes bacterium]|nr:hypothetical protein [Bacillota bacterium]
NELFLHHPKSKTSINLDAASRSREKKKKAPGQNCPNTLGICTTFAIYALRAECASWRGVMVVQLAGARYSSTANLPSTLFNWKQTARPLPNMEDSRKF